MLPSYLLINPFSSIYSFLICYSYSLSLLYAVPFISYLVHRGNKLTPYSRFLPLSLFFNHQRAPYSALSTINWLSLGTIFILLLPSVQFLLIHLFTSNLCSIAYNSVWALTYFSYVVYTFFIVSALLYILPNLPAYVVVNNFTANTPFISYNGTDLLKLLLTPIFLLLLVHTTWIGPSLTAWFGHLIFSNFQFKLTYVLYSFFITYLVVLLSTHHASSLNFFDFVVTVLNFFMWVWVLSFSSNVFTFIFFLELLSAAVTLLLVTSTFSSYHFYSNISFTQHSYFQISTPTSYLQTLMFFFWITLFASLALFLFLITFYLKFFTFDFSLVSSIFTFLVVSSSLKSLLSISLTWFMFLIAISIKCGLLPFYLWKPSFFKGMTMVSLFYYIYIYYFTVLFMFLYVVGNHFHELFTFYLSFTLVLVIIATIGLVSIVFESFYFKAFLALSSIFNSTLLLYALCGFQTIDLLLNI